METTNPETLSNLVDAVQAVAFWLKVCAFGIVGSALVTFFKQPVTINNPNPWGELGKLAAGAVTVFAQEMIAPKDEKKPAEKKEA